VKQIVISDELHAEMKAAAQSRGMVLQSFAEQAIRRGLRRKSGLPCKKETYSATR